MPTGHETVASWRAGRSPGMTIGESDTLLGDAIDVRRLDLLRSVATDITVTHMIGEDEDDVWFVCFGKGVRVQQRTND